MRFVVRTLVYPRLSGLCPQHPYDGAALLIVLLLLRLLLLLLVVLGRIVYIALSLFASSYNLISWWHHQPCLDCGMIMYMPSKLTHLAVLIYATSH